MPTTNTPALVTPEEVEKNNADVAAKQAAQDLAGQSNAPEDSSDTASALDALAELVTKEKADAPEEKDADVTKPEAKPVVTTPDPVKEAADKAASEEASKKAATEEATKKRADDIFKDTPSLPAGASPKSSEAFASVKIKAAQEISSREQKIEELEKKNKELEDRLANPIPDETVKELEDLRQFRARLDVEADPAFKEFDRKVASGQEFIYDQLRKSPAVTDEVIEKIKKLGGPEKVNLDKLFESIGDPDMKRLVEHRISEIEQIKWQKEQSIKTTKANIKEHLEKRQQEADQFATGHRQSTQAEIDVHSKKLEWLAEKKDTATATAEEKAANAEHNKFVATVRGHMKAALEDDSPQMRGIMTVGMAQLLYLQRVHAASESVHAKAIAAKDADIAAKAKEVEELTAKLARLTRASRHRDSSAPDTAPPAPLKKDDFSISTGDALEAAARQVVEERAKKAS